MLIVAIMAPDAKPDLKTTRSRKKALVTRRLNELKRLVAEDNMDEVILKFESIRDVFKEFENAHFEYHETIQDEADIIDSDKYFDDVEENYTAVLIDIKAYINHDVSNKAIAADTVQIKTPAKPASVAKLPRAPNPDVFSGHPESYPMWKASFNTLIGKHDIGHDEKMFYLKQYTSGEARSAIESLFLCPSKESYDAALKILEDRFGNTSLVSAAFRNKLDSWPKISERDGKGLQKFSDYLNQICVVKESYKSLKILDDEFENKKILKKLPTWLVQKWIEKVVNSKEFPTFDQFSAFISDRAKVENHALWDSQLPASHSSKSQTQHAVKGNPTESGHNHAHVLQASRPAGDTLTKVTPTDHRSKSKSRSCPVCSAVGHKAADCCVFINKSLADRKSIIREKKMCFGCLNPGHRSSECRSRHTCLICNKRHPTTLHDYEANKSNEKKVTFALLTDSACHNRITTMVVPVIVRHPTSDKEALVYALLDTQSNTNFVTNEVVNMLEISGKTTSLNLSTMNGRTQIPTERIDSLEIRGVLEDKYIDISSCFTRDSIPCSRESIPTNDILKNHPNFSEIKLPPYYKDAPIGLLIGYHCTEVMRPLKVIPGVKDGIFGWKTCIGWCVVGGAAGAADCMDDCMDDSMDEIGRSHVLRGCIALLSDCREIMSDSSDDCSTLSTVLPGMEDSYSADDVKFMKIMSTQTTQRNDRHYEAPLPLKSEEALPFNRSVAQKRLTSLKSKFERDPEYFDKYKSVMEELIENNFAEPVPHNDLSPVGRTCYIPHHGVMQGPKLRVVYDASSKCRGVSLNDRLLQGPNQTNLLLGILLRFRLEPIALACDVQKMFYQFIVKPNDRDLLRFLWWEDSDFNKNIVDLRMRAHIFGAASSPGVATYCLRKIASDHGSKHSPAASEFVSRDFYVDDGLTSLPTPSKACALFKETQHLLKEGGLRLHKVISNSAEVMEGVPLEDRAPIDESNLHKMLGILWNVITDDFCFRLDFVQAEGMNRKGLLSSVHKFYDPHGCISPLVHQGKLILQQTCRENYDWNDSLSGPILNDLERWCSTLQDIGSVTVPRRIKGDVCHSPELHHFSDASATGYAACSYLRYRDEHGNWQVTFLIGKCRVAPLKPVLTIPRLELVGAVLCVKLASQLRRELPLSCEEYFWTDSTVVLGYIKNTAARFKVFVANRVQSIHDGSEPHQWHHVSGLENTAADSGSRGVWSEVWLRGPDFLREEALPIEDDDFPIQNDDTEVRTLSCNSHEDEEEMKIHTFKNWYGTMKVWAWILRFVSNCRRGTLKKTGELTVDEIEYAKVKTISMVQRSHFAKEHSVLARRGKLPRSSPLQKLDVFLDQDGLLRIGGRMRLSTLSEELKHPVVLPAASDITAMVIQHYHEKTHHQGRGITCNEIRSHGFWIISLHRLVKKLIHACVVCSRLRGKPCEQKMADLPPDRLSPSGPFTYCGCDTFGPFSVKSGRRQVKRWGVIHTCLVSRAVHIEVVHSLSTDSFINAFRRFQALRGPVRMLRCDNGTNFVGAKGDLTKMGCDMEFNPPDSSHRGGVFERMIGAARRVIEGVLVEHAAQLDDEGLLTVMAEASAVINSRPLSVTDASDPNSLEPLTPNHLLTMKSKVIPKLPESLDTSRPDLYASRQWRRCQYLIDLFWTRWKREIIQIHLPRSKWTVPRPNIKVGDVVLVVDEQNHRSFWKMARVIDAHKSADGLVRSARVRMADRSELERPVQKLVHLLSP